MLIQETEDYWIWNDDTLVFKPEFNKPLDDYINIIKNYDKLIFSNYSDIVICIKTNNQFECGFIKYYFNSNFNQSVINLPPNITHLSFGFCFNQEVNNLPPNITHLSFGCCFNQEVNIPFSVKYLKLDCNNQNIIDYLPDSIEELELDYYFNLELTNLPSSLKKIIFNENSNYNKNLNCLPKKLELLQLPRKYNLEIKNIPNGLKKVICSKNYKYINNFKDLKIETYKIY